MYSPLQLLALSFHQTVTDKVYHYRSAINWESKQGEWFVEPSNFPKLFVWKFLNFVIIGFGVSTCIFVLFDTLYNPEKYHLLVLFFVVMEFLCGTTSIITCICISKYANESVMAANALQNLSFQLCKNHFRVLKNAPANRKCCQVSYLGRNRFTKRTCSRTYQNILSNCCRGALDSTACSSILQEIGLTLIPFLLTPIGIGMKWDAPYFVFKEYFPPEDSCDFCKVFVLLCRIIVAGSATIEVINSVRTVTMFSTTTFQNIKICISKLSALSPRLITWRVLKVVILLADELFSILISVYLSLAFLLEIIFITDCFSSWSCTVVYVRIFSVDWNRGVTSTFMRKVSG